MLVHTYPPLLLGKLVKRYKRFFADIELESGEVITAHCANTGPMTGISTVGGLVGVSRSDNPKRKLPYSWEIIQVGETWVGVHTGLPNQVIGYMLKQHLIPELEPYDTIQPEVAYGQEKSRIDFVLTNTQFVANSEVTKTSVLADVSTDLYTPVVTKTYVEIKNTTWTKDNLALFPDTVTERGQKHLRELIAIASTNSNTKTALIYFINRGDCDLFAPGATADPVYAELLAKAIAAGVKVLPCRFNVTPTGLEYLGLAKLSF